MNLTLVVRQGRSLVMLLLLLSGLLGELALPVAATAQVPQLQSRYLVTYMRSDANGITIRSATVVTVTNQSGDFCDVTVLYFDGASSHNLSPLCTVTLLRLSPDVTVNFCSRDIPNSISGCNQTCSPPLMLAEGRVIVSSTCREIGVSGRVYYMGTGDFTVSGISDSQVVVYGAGNNGD